MSVRAQAVAGVAVAATGAAGVAGKLHWVAAFAYPIVWWGLLCAIDAWNAARWGQSPMRRDWRHFFGVTIPLSALFWLLFEYLNLAYPQWSYRGHLPGTATQVVFGFVSFATVIPIMVELQWLVGGPATGWGVTARTRERLRRARAGSIAAGVAFAALPVVSDQFWLNQAAWIAPAMAAIPFAADEKGLPLERLSKSAVFAGLAGGLLWEAINYWALTKWVYTIHPDWYRLFEMPLAGYLGFVPFAFSALAVYAVHLRVRPRAAVVAALYAGALAAMYGLVWLYRGTGLWVDA